MWMSLLLASNYLGNAALPRRRPLNSSCIDTGNDERTRCRRRTIAITASRSCRFQAAIQGPRTPAQPQAEGPDCNCDPHEAPGSFRACLRSPSNATVAGAFAESTEMQVPCEQRICPCEAAMVAGDGSGPMARGAARLSVTITIRTSFRVICITKRGRKN